MRNEVGTNPYSSIRFCLRISHFHHLGFKWTKIQGKEEWNGHSTWSLYNRCEGRLLEIKDLLENSLKGWGWWVQSGDGERKWKRREMVKCKKWQSVGEWSFYINEWQNGSFNHMLTHTRHSNHKVSPSHHTNHKHNKIFILSQTTNIFTFIHFSPPSVTYMHYTPYIYIFSKIKNYSYYRLV